MNPTYVLYDGTPVGDGDELLAGGTDLVTLMRSGLHRPPRLVDLKAAAGPGGGVVEDEGGWRLGAGTTLSAIEDHAGLRSSATALTRAAASAATRQLRNRATIAGNLLQRSRCSYYRDPEIDCWLTGGTDCPARAGLHEHHAIVDVSPCLTTQPSDPATALVALGATITYTHAGDMVTVPVAELLAAPTDDDRRLHRLPPGAVVSYLDVPKAAHSSTYLKAMDRAAWQFALVGVALVRDAAGAATVVASGIAPTPHRLTAVVETLGTDWSERSIGAAADAAGDGLNPGERSRYKVGLLRGLVHRALSTLADER